MKNYAIAAVLLSCLFLCACGTSSLNTSSRNAASSDASISEPATNYPTFGGSAAFCADAIGTSLEEGGTYNAFADEPKVLDQDSDIFGEIRCYSYPVCAGVYAMLYENRDTELCYQLSLSINWSEVNAWDNSINLISDYTVVLLLAA